MSPLKPIFAFIVYFISYATTYIFNTKHLKRNDSLSFDTIDEYYEQIMRIYK